MLLPKTNTMLYVNYIAILKIWLTKFWLCDANFWLSDFISLSFSFRFYLLKAENEASTLVFSED